jgi:membrane-bound serine protease (ClpP class)
MKQKMENDAAAFLRSYTTKRGRNAELAEEAVRGSRAFSADEALDGHLIDLTAASDGGLLAAVDGRTIARMDGSQVTLHLSNARVVDLQPTIREQLLGWLANPNLALLMLVAGALLIYLEFNTPGTIVPGALGTVMVLVAVFALNLLPLRHTALLLLAAAVVLLVLEIKFTTHGVLGSAALVCLAFGTLSLVAAPIPELAVHPGVAIALSLTLGLITLLLVRLAIRARRRKFLLGSAALVGATASSMEPLGAEQPYGRILVQGEIWEARAKEPIAADTPVRVLAEKGNVLEVEEAAEEKTEPGA